MAQASTDYGALAGIHSLAAAILFAVLYFPMCLWFVRQSIKNTTFVYIVLALFCLMRMVAFIMRAIIADSTSAASNLGVFVADQVLFGVGFFAVLYGAYTLVLDRNVIAGREAASMTTLNIFRNSNAFRLMLSASVALGIVGTVDSTSSSPSDVSTGHTLRKVSTIMFCVLTVVQTAQTIWFIWNDGFGPRKSTYGPDARWGDRHARTLLYLISILLLIRELFLTVTINDTTNQDDERLWYPLVALPEFLAVICYSVSGLVPTREALRAASGSY